MADPRFLRRQALHRLARRFDGHTSWNVTLQEDQEADSGWISAVSPRVSRTKFPDAVESGTAPPPPKRIGICRNCGSYPGPDRLDGDPDAVCLVCGMSP